MLSFSASSNMFDKFGKTFFNFGYKWVSLKGTTKSILRTSRQASIFRGDTILAHKRGTANKKYK